MVEGMFRTMKKKFGNTCNPHMHIETFTINFTTTFGLNNQLRHGKEFKNPYFD